MSRKSLISGTLVILVWITTMVYLYKNHYGQAEPLTDYDDETFFQSVKIVDHWKDVDEYMVVRQNDRTIGASVSKIHKLDNPDKSATYSLYFGTELKLAALLPPVNVKLDGLLDEKQNLSSFEAKADLGVAAVEVSGRIVNSMLYLRTVNSNQTKYQKIKLKNPVNLASSVRPLLGKQMDIKPGSKMSTQVVDPLTGQNRGTLQIQVLNKEPVQLDNSTKELYKVTSTLGEIQTTMWVDEAGQTHKRQLIGTFTMDRASSETVKSVAPTLTEMPPIAPLDLNQFRDIPATDTLQSGSSDSTLRVLQQLIN